ncbi:MAG TPA: hypothetical protein PLK80_00845 [bacterium]|nr:hypothetical protein [bacterium]HPI75254.1 hypothetical protein [bacterium]
MTEASRMLLAFKTGSMYETMALMILVVFGAILLLGIFDMCLRIGVERDSEWLEKKRSAMKKENTQQKE